MKIQVLFWACFFWWLGPIHAQVANALLLGEIEGDYAQVIRVSINKRYIDNTIVEYETQVKNGKFGLTFQLEFPQLIYLKYGNKETTVFMEPDDTLKVHFNALQFPQLTFSARSADHNRFWQQFMRAFPQERDFFRQLFYRVGAFNYPVPPQWDSLMRYTPVEAYTGLVRREQLNKQSMLDFYAAEKTHFISEGFRAYMRAEIEYEAQMKLLMYGDIYGKRHKLTEAYMHFMDSLSQETQALGHIKYRNFIEAYINYWDMRQPMPKHTTYARLYAQANARLDSLTRYVYQAQLLAKGLRRGDVAATKPLYEDFIRQNPYVELDKQVVDALQRARQHAEGVPAPDFVLQDAAGQPHRLSDYQGKWVYLYFWATWCRPCMKKLRALQPLIEEFAGREVVFISVTIDRDYTLWKETLTKEQFGGIQLFAYGALPTQIIEDYEVFAVPKYFLLDPQGRFMAGPHSSEVQALALLLRSLIH